MGLGLFSIAMKKTTTKSDVERKGFNLACRLKSTPEGSQDRDTLHEPGGRN